MENIQKKSPIDQNKVWKVLLPIAATVFLIMSISMIWVDQRYYVGILYLITSILHFSSAYLIATGKADIMKSSSNEQLSLALGFIVITIGLVLNGIFWGVGFVLFLAGILSIRKSSY